MVVAHLLANGNIGGTEILCSNYIRNSKNTNIVVCLWGMGPIADEMREFGQTVIDLHCTHFNILRMINRLVAVCDDYNVQVIVAHHSIAASHMSLLLLKHRRPNIKLVFYAQSDARRMCRANHKYLESIQYIIIKNFYKKAELAIAISESVRDSLRECFGERMPQPIILHNGIPINNRENLFLDRKKEMPTIIYVGRLIQEKGVQITLRALEGIKEPYCFKIVGDGPYRKELESLCKDLAIFDKVEFLGARRDIYKLLRNSDFFIHVPICQEGFGLTIVEAMSNGLVCIGSSNGAIPEIIEDQESGYIVAADENSLRTCITKCFRAYKNGLDNEMRKKAMRRADEFSLEKYVCKLDDILKAL